MFSYLELEDCEKDQVVNLLFSWLLGSRSNIVRVSSMQTLANLAEDDEELRHIFLARLKEIIKGGSPSIVSRGKKVIKRLTEMNLEKDA